MHYLKLFLVVGVVCIFFSSTYADIPKVINFQGRLTDAAGKFVSDGNYSLTFKIYTDSTGGSSKWSETQSVAVSKGLFNAILGSQTPIPDSIFNYSNTWLGIQVASDPEMTPRQRLSSLGYAYRGAKSDTSSYSINSDKLDGFHASDFASIGSDYGRPGVATDLYEGTSTLTSKYVNTVGPDSVYASSGTAFLGKSSGSSISPMFGIRGYGDNSSSGDVYGGTFSTSSAGTGWHFGVRTEGLGSSSSPVYGSFCSANNTGSGSSFGTFGHATNSSSGLAYGGYFSTSFSGSGWHYGVAGEAYSASAATYTIGSYGNGLNTSTGNAYGCAGDAYSASGTAYGGFFSTSSSGSGDHYGVYGLGRGTTLMSVYGGYFETSPYETGDRYGVVGRGFSSSAFGSTVGSYGFASNTSSGTTYGGWFETSDSGSGEHCGVLGYGLGNSSVPTYGARGFASGNSTGSSVGVNGWAQNSSSANAYGGWFEAAASGSGEHCGVLGLSSGYTSSTIYGSYGSAFNSSTGSAIGAYGYAANSSGGNAYGGYFTTAVYPSGEQYGVVALGNGNTAGNVYGIRAEAYNISGKGYAGYFYASSGGTGDDFGVYAYEASGGTGAAVYASGDFVASGTKNAVLKTSKGHRLMSVIESPEVWFEDFGEGQLINGKAHVELDPLFLETVAVNVLNPMKVFIQLNDENCKGTAVKRGMTGFDVVELSGGTSNASFSYRVVAKRKGYETERLRQTDVGKDDPNLYPELLAQMEKKHQEERTRMEEEQKKMGEERIKMEKERERMKIEKLGEK